MTEINGTGALQTSPGQMLFTPDAFSQLKAIENPSINLPILVDPKEALEILYENLEGFEDEIRFDKISMPSAGGTSFQIVGLDGQETSVSELEGIIIHKAPFRCWYKKLYEEKTEEDTGMPDCLGTKQVIKKIDPRTGQETLQKIYVGSGCEEAGIPAGQHCDTCPKGQWGSNRKGGDGQDCSERIRLHFLMKDRVFPLCANIPPTSLRRVKGYFRHLGDIKKRYYGVVTHWSLVTVMKGGKKRSEVSLAKVRDLTDEEIEAIRMYVVFLRPAMEIITKESFETDSKADKNDNDINKMDFESEEQPF